MKAGLFLLSSLLGLALGQSCPDSAVADGFASVGSGTTGGGNAAPVTVTSATDLRAAARASGRRVIVVRGTIDTNGVVEVSSDKTIIGQDARATIVGGFRLDRVKNVIIKNLNVKAGAAADALASTYSTNESDYQTVSWCKFWYSNPNADHRLASLLGSGGGTQPNDEGKLHVSYHHNWFAENVDQRMPRVMYGDAHIYNNYYSSKGNSYCIGTGSYGSSRIENNYFKDVKNPHEFMYDVYAYASSTDNIYDNVSGNRQSGRFGSEHAAGQESFTSGPVSLPYSAKLDAAASVPALVQRCAGPRATTPGSSAPAPASPPSANTLTTSTTKAPSTPTQGGGSGTCAAQWAQCGGSGFSGPKCCSQGSCKVVNEYYHQCA
ncbi:hypothetical protein ACHAQA_008074 [Verticillium albo-atrum]